MLRLAFLCLAFFWITPLSAQIMLGRASAVDGDTFTIGNEMVRLHGIDALERDQLCSRGTETWPCGEAARMFLQQLLDSGTLRCRQLTRDSYDRAVSSCDVGPRDIALELVSAGFAVVLEASNATYTDAEARARSGSHNMWGGEFQMPAQYRASHAEFDEPRAPQLREAENVSSSSRSTEANHFLQVYYRNCASARRAGAAPLRRGEAGYRPALDADNDGIACEPYRGR